MSRRFFYAPLFRLGRSAFAHPSEADSWQPWASLLPDERESAWWTEGRFRGENFIVSSPWRKRSTEMTAFSFLSLRRELVMSSGVETSLTVRARIQWPKENNKRFLHCGRNDRNYIFKHSAPIAISTPNGIPLLRLRLVACSGSKTLLRLILTLPART